MSARPSLAVVKPDYGSHGGFERHLDLLVNGLRERGWRPSIVELDGRTRPSMLYGLPIGDPQRHRHDDYFLLLSLVEQTQHLDLSRFDAVLTTQPPTYLVRHRCKVALFYHHPRQFYDLAEPYAASGFVDPEIHAAACDGVRRLESDAVADVRHWLAGSATVAARLRDFWAIPDERISIHQAPPTTTVARPAPYDPTGPVVCVGRHEWPKRTELVVEAMHLSGSDRIAHLVGGGSRARFVATLDQRLAANPALAGTLTAEQLWRNRGHLDADSGDRGQPSGRVVFEEEVDDARRDALYDGAAVVVAPAFGEDYGLTAIEAMTRARPVIVCDDGGGLTELVSDGETGTVVEPSGKAIAAAIDDLLADPARAERLGAAGRARVESVTAAQAIDQTEATLLAALDALPFGSADG